MLRLLLPKAAAPVLIRLLLLAFLSCRLLPFPSSPLSSSGVGGSGKSSSELVLVQSRLYPERNVVRLVAPVAATAAPAVLSSSSPAEVLPAMLLLRGVGGLPFRTAQSLAPGAVDLLAVGTPVVVGGGFVLPPLLLILADRGVGGLPPPPDFDGTTFLLLPVAPLLLVAPAVVLSVPLLTGLGGSPPRFPLMLVVEVLTLVGMVQSASVAAVELVVGLMLFALMASGCPGSFSVSFVVASGAPSESEPLLLLLPVAPSTSPLPPVADPSVATVAVTSPPTSWLETLAPASAFCVPSACAPRTSSAAAAASSMFSLAETLSEGVGVVLGCFCLLAIAAPVGVAFWELLRVALLALELVLVLLASRRSVGFCEEEDTTSDCATGGRRLLVLLLVACRLLDSPALRCAFALAADVLAPRDGRGLPVKALVAVAVDVSSSSSRSLLVEPPSFFTVSPGEGAEDLELVRLVLAVLLPLLVLADGLDDDDGREGMLARIPPPTSPDAAAGEADLRVLMVLAGGLNAMRCMRREASEIVQKALKLMENNSEIVPARKSLFV